MKAESAGALSFVIDFPWAAINVAFASALQKGHWSAQPVQSESEVLGQNLGFLTFAPSYATSADYKRQWDETNTVYDEDMAAVDKNHRTKVGVKLFDGGKVTSYKSLMATIANFVVALMTADRPGQASEALVVTNLKQIFLLLSQTDMKSWIERHSARGGPGEHLPYALALEIHMSIIQLAAFATNSARFHKTVLGEDIPAEALEFYIINHSQLIGRLRTACVGDSLAHYAAPPSTWVPYAKQKPKEIQSKKSPKTGESSSPGGTRSSGPNNRSPNNGFPNSTGAAARGMITATPAVRNGPNLSNGQLV
jgi:hypothetical protein